MRSTGGCTIQQALTIEAANIVKQAVTLAKRRGHAQVTPLHVANTMLSSSSNGIFKTACLQSHSHPLQCKALELCFNVALNRLPASSSSPMLMIHQHHSQYPSISNALVAAFKRAQAHQRRGSLENQQQPLLALKIELEQLIISILDDPSVSRVMREAGFDSTQVKNNVEQVVSLELCSPSPNTKENCKIISPFSVKDEDDVMSVVESLMKKNKKNIVMVSENIDNLESVIKGVMNKVENRDVPDELKEIKFISLPLMNFGNIQREEVDQRIRELTCLIKSLVKKGVVLYLGDLKWIVDYRANNNNYGDQRRSISYYCSIEHMIMEIGRLVCSFSENEKFWLMGIATFQSYMRCKSGNNSLESVWGLHPVTVPGGSLGLSLNPDSDTQIELRSKTFEGEFSCGEEKLQLNCCFNSESTLSNLPSWLKDERPKEYSNNHHHDQNCVSVKDLHKKWNTNTTCNLPFWANRKTCETNSNSASNSSDVIMEIEYSIPKFKEFNSENLNILSNALEEIVPWKKGIIIQEIASTILQCRSGMIKRKTKSSINESKQESWLFFKGPDFHAKEKIARELSNVVFGSYMNFVSITLSNFCSNFRNKRSRDDQQSLSYIDKFAKAVSCNSHCVFYLEDLDEIDYCSLREIKKVIERGIITNTSSGEEVSLDDAIIILSCENFGSKSRDCCSSPNVKKKYEETTTTTTRSPNCCVSLDLNLSIDEQYGSSGDQDLSIHDDDIGILQSVDRCIFFQNSRTTVE